VYRRRCPTPSPETLARALRPPPDAVLVGSGETLANLWALAGDSVTAWTRTRWVVPGERVAERARALGLACVHRAANATDDAMVAALMAGCGEKAR
jgi:uroporphyrinogen-III synthase